MLPFLDQPLVQAYLPIFWFILFATLLRIAADAYGFVLLALYQDRAIAIVAVGGSIASSGLNLTLISLAGLWGAAGAYALTSGGLFAVRYMLSRPAKWLGPPGSDSAGQTGGRQRLRGFVRLGSSPYRLVQHAFANVYEPFARIALQPPWLRCRCRR